MKLSQAAGLVSHLYPLHLAPRGNADGMAKLMVLVAQDVATISETGRTIEMVEDDARTCMYGILDGTLVL